MAESIMRCSCIVLAILAIVGSAQMGLRCHGGGAYASEKVPDGQSKPAGDPSLIAATSKFNRETAKARRTLFEPPILDLTVEQLRDGLRQTEAELRKLKLDDLANCLNQIVISDRLPPDAFFGASGTTTKDADGQIITRQIVPAIRLPDAEGERLIPLSSLNLIYRKGGPSSITYGPILRQKKK